MSQQTFNTVVAIAAVIIGLSFIVQAAALIFIYGAVKKLNATAASLQAKADPLLVKAGPMLDQVQGTLATVKGSVEKISAQARDTFDKVTVETRAISAAVSASSQEITNLARRQATQISSTLDYSTATIQRQVASLDGLLTRTQNRIEGTTIELQTTVVEPIREVASLLAGLRRTLEMLFGRGRKTIDRAYQDEEMFI